MRSRHAVYVTPANGPTFRVGQPVDWSTAQARWQRLDDRRLLGRTQRVRFDGRRYPVAMSRGFIEVRAVDDHGRGLGSERHERAFPVPYRAIRVDPKGR